MKAVLSAARFLAWLLALATLLVGAFVLDKSLGMGRVLLGIAAGLCIAGGAGWLLFKNM